MANGYAGKILRINLSTKETGIIDTERYEAFGGGYGMGAAIFWDLAVAPGEWDLKDPYDPRNVLPLMVGPLAATGVPGSGQDEHLRALSGNLPVLRILAGQSGRKIRNNHETRGLGRRSDRGQGRKARVDQHRQ